MGNFHHGLKEHVILSIEGEIIALMKGMKEAARQGITHVIF
jgi:hypothetical protein